MTLFLFAHKIPSEKGSALKEKNLFPSHGSGEKILFF